jgi:hypothetical protein
MDLNCAEIGGVGQCIVEEFGCPVQAIYGAIYGVADKILLLGRQ